MLTACYFELRSELRNHRFQVSLTLDTENPNKYFVHYRSWFTRGRRSSWKTPDYTSLPSEWVDNVDMFKQPGLTVLGAALASTFDASAYYCNADVRDTPPVELVKNTLLNATQGLLHLQFDYKLLPIEYFSLPATDSNIEKLSKYKTAPWPIINRAKAAYIKKGIDF